MVIFFYGLSGAGKTTLAQAFQTVAPDVFILDGDILREGLCCDLGFSAVDRCENLRRAMHCARILSLAGKTAAVAMIAPYEVDRQMAADICSDVEFVDVFVDCPLEVCEKRDVKGLYAKARAGEIESFTGVSDPFEVPSKPAYIVRTDTKVSPEYLASTLFSMIWHGSHLSRRSCTIVE